MVETFVRRRPRAGEASCRDDGGHDFPAVARWMRRGHVVPEMPPGDQGGSPPVAPGAERPSHRALRGPPALRLPDLAPALAPGRGLTSLFPPPLPHLPRSARLPV